MQPSILRVLHVASVGPVGLSAVVAGVLKEEVSFDTEHQVSLSYDIRTA